MKGASVVMGVGLGAIGAVYVHMAVSDVHSVPTWLWWTWAGVTGLAALGQFVDALK